ncbi:AAA domain-containing protein [Pseudonocardia cypriaca]|uniref:AAA domain-containing protein n=1 Tax=Pseudonocardia cypriaca TaxID=882449 RepID=UPI00114DF697|nr:AAA domain-containing protein [Pseudonocardia cypriaca]
MSESLSVTVPRWFNRPGVVNGGRMGGHWKADVVAAVERWAAVEAGSSRAGSWVDLGPADPHADGRLLVDARDRRVAFLDACLAGERGPEHERTHPVEELRDEAGVLVVRPAAGTPEEGRRLWVRAAPIVGSLLDGLRAVEEAPLAEALAEKRPAGSPTSDATAEGLDEEQVEAFRACLSPGLRLVWAPPGTGRTEVLARAIEALVDEGKRVLLVSTVEEALDAVTEQMSAEPGVAVRIGREVLGAEAAREVEEECAAVAAELRAIEELIPEAERLRAELGGFDERGYRVACARLVAGRTLAELRPRLRDAEASADAARRGVVGAANELREALNAQAALGPVRDAFEHQRLAVEGLAVLAQRQRTLEEERDALAAQEPPGLRARRQHRRLVEAADAELRRFTSAAAAGRRRWLDVQLQTRAVIGEHTQAEIDDADQRVANAENLVAAADEGYRHARELLIRLRGEVDAAEARGEPTEDDRRLVAESEARGLPDRHARLRELLFRLNGGAALGARYRELAGRARELRADAEARLVHEARVVATTLTRSRLHPALADAAFDAVLVDEAGGTPVAEVLLALCRASTTAVVFGDFLQAGCAVPDDQSPDFQRWVRGTCFSHLGIATPADVEAHEGCLALTNQSRFGAGVRRLADETLYERLRDVGEPRTDVVLIDVSTVPDLAAARPGAVVGSWSAAGAVLARALAERHLRDGSVGVVTADVVQADLTLAALRDRGLVSGVAVGPVAALQGREFATVVLDLAAGDDGPRTLGAGITLARDRVYLVADGVADGPLRAAVERGDVRVWSAAALLGVAEPPADDPAFTEVSELLRADVHDGQELARHLAAAQRSVWVCAPWGDADGALQEAAGRGVRVHVSPGSGDVAAAESGHQDGGIVVVDEQVVLLEAGQSMVAISGPALAGRLLAELQADSSGEPQVGIPEQRQEPVAAPAVS